MRSLGKDLKGLYDLGFAVHLLKPRSKAPLESRWTTGARKTWKELDSAFQPGMNVGVRLGQASKIGKGFLAVIDCDVKSSEVVHQDLMAATLTGLFAQALDGAPVVLSGRGNGSCHIYVATPSPVKSRRLIQSPDKVRVKMPSVERVSKFERDNLTADELADGIRIRPAWEISLMGEGSQVVLPPSVHPDSGKKYAWKVPFRLGALPSLPDLGEGRGKSDLSVKTPLPFTVVPVDLLCSSLPDSVIAQIETGDGVSDASAALLGVTNQMVRHGFSDDEILSVLTDEAYFLGGVGFRHAQTSDRARAADWVRRYTLDKSKKELSAQAQFEEDCQVEDLSEEPRLTVEEAAAQAESIREDQPYDWRDDIERGGEQSGFRPKNTLKNVILILSNEAGATVFKRDEFANAEIYGLDAPWGSKRGAEVNDLDQIRIKTWLAAQYRFEPSKDRIEEAISRIADLNRFHPVREYLDALDWDGKPRLDTWLKRYLNASAPEPYLSAVSRKVLCAMIARIYRPGTKFDQVLILEGVQGVGKSTALRFLASDAWFTDAKFNVTDKDAVVGMRSIWLVELGELSGMRSADVDDLKAFISKTTDRIRVPYGRRAEDFPRQCVFIGTTNRDEYLKDPTGNRRFWPVKVGECDFRAIRRDRDQLLAEAKFAYELGEPLYLEDPEMVDGSIREQAAREVTDSFEEIIDRWLEEEKTEESDGGNWIPRTHFTMGDLFSSFGPLAEWKQNLPELKRAGDALRKLGFTKRQAKMKGKNIRVWSRFKP